MDLVWSILRFAWPYLLGAAILALGYYKLEHYCNTACEVQTQRADKLQELSDAAHKRADDLTQLYVATAAAADKKLADQMAGARADAARIQSHVGALSPLPTLAISSNAWSVFADASDLANAASAPANNQAAAKALSEAALGQYALDAADAYRDAYSHWSACVNFYEDLRK